MFTLVSGQRLILCPPPPQLIISTIFNAFVPGMLFKNRIMSGVMRAHQASIERSAVESLKLNQKEDDSVSSLRGEKGNWS